MICIIAVCNVSIGATNASLITPTSNVTSSPNIPYIGNTGEFTTHETKGLYNLLQNEL